MDMLDRYFGVSAKALELRAERLEILASNIANAATPGYKARDLDFAAALTASNPSAAIKYRVPMAASLDGNTVELATEQTQFAENAVQYRSTLAFLTGRIGTLITALTGGEA